jgi:hypothetical protein
LNFSRGIAVVEESIGPAAALNLGGRHMKPRRGLRKLASLLAVVITAAAALGLPALAHAKACHPASKCPSPPPSVLDRWVRVGVGAPESC